MKITCHSRAPENEFMLKYSDLFEVFVNSHDLFSVSIFSHESLYLCSVFYFEAIELKLTSFHNYKESF